MQGCEWVTDHALAKAGLPHIQELEVSYTPCGDCSLTALALVRTLFGIAGIGGTFGMLTGEVAGILV